MRKFDFYEFAGIIVPGALVCFGLSFIFPDLKDVLVNKDISVGGLGIFVILAYAVGHLSQAIGNGIESLWWGINCGMPTNWIRLPKQKLLAQEQIDKLPEQINKYLGYEVKTIGSYDAEGWSGITRQIYAAVAAQGKVNRVETFNGNYGLNRGIASAVLIISIARAIELGFTDYKFYIVSFLVFLFSISRMHRFGRHYARELFVQFLQLKEEEKK